MSTIEAVSPTRIDLAGGTLDCWPLYALVGGCKTINFGIDVLTRAKIHPRSDGKIVIECKDLSYLKEFSHLEEVLSSLDKELTIVKPQLEFWRPQSGFELSLSSDSPVGGGLGGSSSLTVSMLKAFKEWQKVEMDDLEMVELARDIETGILGKPAGTQDYIPAIGGGLCNISYELGKVSWSSSFEGIDFFNDNCLLVYTGEPHHSGLNNWDIIKASVEGDDKVMAALREIKSVSDEMELAVAKADMNLICELFDREFLARQDLSDSYITQLILDLKERVIRSGGRSVKVCGAGGGGCVLVVADQNTKSKIKADLVENEFQIIPFKVWHP